MFITAEAFLALRAAAQVTVENGNPTILELTMGTIMAFSVETYLKCLRMVECGEILSGHDLKELFDDLPEPIRSEIRFRHAQHEMVNKAFKELRKSRLPTDLQFLLAKGKDFFDDCRYAYEGEQGDGVWSSDVFMLIIKDLILERKPEWDTAQLNRRRLPRI